MKKVTILIAACALLCAETAGCAGPAGGSAPSAAQESTAAQETAAANAAGSPESVAAEPAGEEAEAAATAPEVTAEAAEAASAGETGAAGDHAAFVGTWSETLDNGARHFVIIQSVDGDNITFTVNTVYPNAAHLVGSNDISGVLSGGSVSFDYSDTFGNTGSGVLTLYDGYVHVTVTSNFDGSIAYLNFDSDLYEHTDRTGPAFS